VCSPLLAVSCSLFLGHRMGLLFGNFHRRLWKRSLACGLLSFGVCASRAAKADAEVGASAAAEESVRLHGLLLGTRALTGYQSREYGWGPAGILAVEWGPSQVWGIQAEVGALGLLGVDEPAPIGYTELGATSGIHLGIGLRGRPLALLDDVGKAGGLWLSLALGGTYTGTVVAPVMDAFVGYDFPFEGGYGVGPAVGYLIVIQTADPPRSDNAHLMFVGVHGTFDFGPSEPEVIDRDKDGIQDRHDGCPARLEDRDGFDDQDGCPEPDNDGDNVLDVGDRCPLDAEDNDDFEDEDGCPELDNDHDENPDVSDQCLSEPEDLDEFEDQDGCPETDNDQDQIPDLRDLCPNEPEVLNGVTDNDGCPDAESIRVVGDKIELDQKVHFWTNSARIRGMSYPVLDKLAGFLRDHPEYVHVDIKGHADNRGHAEFNLKLSQSRASAIRDYLISRRIDESRLSAEGFGSSSPLSEGTSEHSHFLNRRVEFIVTRNREVSSSDAGSAPSFGTDKTVEESEEK
jgi:outer membrane protein OmpA-like peptidoglycan-associated protein